MMSDEERIEADMAWWEQVAKVLGANLLGWTYRNSATFTVKGAPTFSLSGVIAENILANCASVEPVGYRVRNVVIEEEGRETSSWMFTERAHDNREPTKTRHGVECEPLYSKGVA